MQWRRIRTVSDAEECQLIRAPFDANSWFSWVADIFRKPSAEKLAYREYEEARRSLLQHQTAREYHDNMCRFETKRIVRLREMLQINEE